MRIYRSEIEIRLKKEEITLCIYEELDHSLSIIEEVEASLNSESPYQLLESRTYGYYFNKDNYQLKPVPGVVSISKGIKINGGRITPNIYVGTLTLEIVEKTKLEDIIDSVDIEILASKLDFLEDIQVLDVDYRKNYKLMLEDIASKCAELLMQINSPVSQNFEPDFEHENETIYQRFAFVKSLIASDDFNDAVNRILYSPATKWKQILEPVDIRKIRRFSNSTVRQITSANRQFEFELSDQIHSVPSRILNSKNTETFDTPENRFIKFALNRFSKFCSDCETRFLELNYSKAAAEATVVINTLQNHLDAPFFKEITSPSSLQLNSPLLQRKSGYREVLNAWMLYDLAAKLIWQGGDKVYRAGKRDIAVLYEYWLFFQLYDLLINKFEFSEIIHGKTSIRHLIDSENISHLTEETKDGLGLKLKSGTETSLLGKTSSETRQLKVRFSYNRTFSGNTSYEKGKTDWTSKQGSWTKPLRPDYTLSFWPSDLEEEDAEREDVIVHIHFDAKYKVRHFQILSEAKLETDENGELIDSLEKEKKEERRGVYKNADLLKMHAYKDAIRRTSGAYVLYPGEGNMAHTNIEFQGYHEIIPGLGAFAVRPVAGDNGISGLSAFIDTVILHFQDRASQRERLSSKGYDIHKVRSEDSSQILNDPMPEYLDSAKKIKLIPDETYVLVGFYKDANHLKWIMQTKYYNARTGSKQGSIRLSPRETGAKYLLLHAKSEMQTSKLFKLKEVGPRIFSKQEMLKKKYPNPGQDFYLVFDIGDSIEKDFENMKWDITKLKEYSGARKSALPFTTSLTELMKVRLK